MACEFSGVVRDAFLARGHDAVSCDLLPTESPGPHVRGDVRPLLRERWDMVIAFPPCTYLCMAGQMWLAPNAPRSTERWHKFFDGLAFFIDCWRANAPHVVVENPLPHAAARLVLGKSAFSTQPFEHGHPFSKRTLFWVTGPVPPLMPTNIVQPLRATRRRKPTPHHPYGKPYHWLDTLPATNGRAQDRSRFFPGIADAMAEQWGNLAA